MKYQNNQHVTNSVYVQLELIHRKHLTPPSPVHTLSALGVNCVFPFISHLIQK